MSWTLIAQGVQLGIQTIQADRAARNELRAARSQQALNNEELVRQIQIRGEQEIEARSQRNLAFGAAGVRGGSATAAAVEVDALRKMRLQQEELARQINTDLQDERTTNSFKELAGSYINAVWQKPFNQAGAEAQRVGKKVENEFRRLRKRLGF